MKIGYLREFIVLAQTLNFRKAAEALYITQPVLSKHISILEEEVGTSLFFRNNHTVKLTKAGELFLKEVRDIVARYDEIKEKIKLDDAGFKGKLGIGMLYYSKEHITPAIELFKKNFPHIKLHFFASTPNEVVNAVLHDIVDIGAVMHVDFPNSHTLTFFDLYQEPLVVMVHRDHHLAGRSSVSMSELKDECFVNVNDNYYYGYFEYIKRLCRRHGFEPKEPALVNDYETLLLTIQSGFGIAVLSANMKKQSNPCSTFVDIEDEDCVITRSIIYKSSNTNPAIPLFLKQFDYLKNELLLHQYARKTMNNEMFPFRKKNKNRPAVTLKNKPAS